MWAVFAASVNHGVPLWVAQDVLKVESRYCKYTSGPDLGCYQISKPTARGYKLDLRRLKDDKFYNIDKGVMLLAQFQKRFKVSSSDVRWVCAYNAGRLKGRNKVCKKYMRRIYENK